MSSSDYLSDVINACNDPALVDTVLHAAWRNDPDAWFALGLIYAEGRGVPMDLQEAYAWLTVAVSHGDKDAEELRYVVAEQLEVEQIQRAKQTAARYQARLNRRERRH